MTNYVWEIQENCEIPDSLQNSVTAMQLFVSHSLQIWKIYLGISLSL